VKPQFPTSVAFAPATLAVLFSTALFAQPATPTPAAAGGAGESPVVLSPFQVEADTDRGYYAQQTLNGTRLKTDLKDIGSSLTVFTEQMLDDLGAKNIYDLMSFAPNTDPFIMSTSDVTGTGNDFINIPTKFVSRGGASTVVAQDFFSNGIPQDRYNSEALTFTRGPNAILFGLGNAAGAFVSSTKRAKMKDARTVEQQMDSRGGHRLTVDLNQVLVKNHLALRYAGLFEGMNSFRLQTNDYQRRHFFTLNFAPFKKTTIRVNYDTGHIQQNAVRPWPDYDAVSPWLAAGSPMIDTFTNVATGKPAGTQNFAYAGLTSTEFSAGGMPIPTQRLQNQGQSVPTTFANGFPVNGANFRSLVNPAIYPTFASAFGNSAYRLTDYHTVSAFLEQQLTRDLFVEAAFNKVDSKLKAINGFVGQLSQIYVDPNRQLPNGAPNPNAGLLYSQSQPTIIDAPNAAENYRAMASYEFDFARHTSNWLRYLGRHQAAVFGEQNTTSGWSSNNGLFNTTPLSTVGAAGVITNAANGIQYRYYYEPAQNKVGTSAGRHLEALPILYANDPLPARAPSGITPAFMSQQGPTMTEAVVRTRALAVQSFFWKDRMVVTNGLRTDDQTSWLAVPNDFGALRDANGIAPRPSGINLRRFSPGSRAERGGHTYSRGVVFHALPWVSLSYNSSNNFQVNSGTRNVFGDLLPNPQGKGADYGVKFSLLDRRLFLDVTYYTNSNVNTGDSISSNAAGNFKQFDQLWIAVSSFTGDPKYLTSPYSTLSTVWQDVVSTTSKGWEFALTANPSKQWRVTLNGSRRGDNTTSARGVYINAYMAQYIPIIKSHSEWQTLDAAGVTVANRVADLENTLVNFNAIRNSPSANFASNWTLNLIQTYEFGRDGWLRNFSVGGSMNARGRAINGFAVDSKFVLDPTMPYYAPSYANFGAWVTYKRKLFRDRIDWRLQLNVRNLFDDNTVFPLINVDTRDGKHTPNTAIYNLKEPRTYQFTSTFRF
jgi:iron complex outermembrane recepter protein